jgi:hypothetical protein
VENYACENCAEKRDIIRDSVSDQMGVTHVNQSAGNLNNQGNLLAIGIDVFTGETPQNGFEGEDGFANAEVSVEQENLLNLIDSANILFRDSFIEDSVNDNIGITQVNQAAGQINNQMNAIAFSFAADGAVTLSEADLGQETSYDLDANGPTVLERFAVKKAYMESSVNRNSGVTHVNQSSGNLGNQANLLSVATGLSN